MIYHFYSGRKGKLLFEKSVSWCTALTNYLSITIIFLVSIKFDSLAASESLLSFLTNEFGDFNRSGASETWTSLSSLSLRFFPVVVFFSAGDARSLSSIENNATGILKNFNVFVPFPVLSNAKYQFHSPNSIEKLLSSTTKFSQPL